MFHLSSFFRSIYRFSILILAAALLAGCAGLEQTENKAAGDSAPVLNPHQAGLKSPLGTVEIQAGSAWTQLQAGGGPVSLGVGQRVRTGNQSSVQLTFADGSQVDLNANSELVIDELNAGSQGQPRVITLTQVAGESRHTVAPAADANSHYEVRTPGGVATAKGTRFSVRVLPQQASYLSVVEGVVEVAAAKSTVTVNAGQMTTIMPNQPPAPPLGHVSGEGAVTQMGETWTIAGLVFKAPASTLLVGDIFLGDVVHFEGHLLADGSRVLDLVILLQTSPANHFRLQGAAEKITGTSLEVNGILIRLTPQTWIEPGIVEGDPVWVAGTILDSGVFEAERITKAGDENGQPFEFTATVQEIGASRWLIAGVAVGVNTETDIGDEISVGKLVWVAGRIKADGTWLADEIKLVDEQEHSFDFTGDIESMAPWKVAGIAFETRSWTRIDPDLKIGDRVWVSGSIDTDGKWVAAEIQRIAAPDVSLILVGPVLNLNPWVVSGITLKTTPQTIIVGSITVGMLVRVEARLLADGTWEAIRIEPLPLFVWAPTCLDLNLVLVSLQGSLVQFRGWPQMTLPPDFKMPAQIVPNSPVLVHVCFSSTFVVEIISITVITVSPPGPTEDTDKVLICHKPNQKKGGKTMLLPRPALGGHLGHGDTLGACHQGG